MDDEDIALISRGHFYLSKALNAINDEYGPGPWKDSLDNLLHDAASMHRSPITINALQSMQNELNRAIQKIRAAM